MRDLEDIDMVINDDEEGTEGTEGICEVSEPLEGIPVGWPEEEDDIERFLRLDFLREGGAEGLRILPVIGLGNDGNPLLVFKKRASSISEGVGVMSASSPSLGVTGSGMETEDAVEEGVRVAYSSAPYPYRDVCPAASEAEE